VPRVRVRERTKQGNHLVVVVMSKLTRMLVFVSVLGQVPARVRVRVRVR
jgi:hypothetical protein